MSSLRTTITTALRRVSLYPTSSASYSSSTSSPTVTGLVGTAPRYNTYLFLHSPHPPRSFEARHATPLQRHLQLHMARWGGFVNFSHGIGPILQFKHGEEDSYAATAYTALGTIRIPEINMDNAQQISDHLRDSKLVPNRDEEVHLYVCTHGARDCRCGDKGGELFDALKEEIERRGVGGKIKVGETAHVGGHKWAANLLVYPFNEWLGLLEAKHAPEIIDKILSTPNIYKQATIDDPPLLIDHWRGRTMYNKPELLQLFEYYAGRAPRPLPDS